MGQGDILKILQELPEDEWISSLDLLEKLPCGRSTMMISLKSMKNYGEVQSREIKETGCNIKFEHRLTERGRL